MSRTESNQAEKIPYSYGFTTDKDSNLIHMEIDSDDNKTIEYLRINREKRKDTLKNLTGTLKKTNLMPIKEDLQITPLLILN